MNISYHEALNKTKNKEKGCLKKPNSSHFFPFRNFSLVLPYDKRIKITMFLI